MNFDKQTYLITESDSTKKRLLAIGLIGLLLSAIGYFVDHEQFFHSYLVAFTFWTVISLGGLFFVLMHHVTGAVWSIVVRRIAEAVMISLPLMILFAIPLGFGIHDLYHWSHVAEHDHLLEWKSPYLNTTFFVIRTVVYFLIWWLTARKLYSLSVNQTGEEDKVKMRKVAAAGTVLFALTFTFASFDWLMSLDAHWYSTIYGVYIFGGAYVTFIALLILLVLLLQQNGILREEVTVEHFHDLGKLLFGFTIFWAYIAGSQYFLIWYGNIPEETIWYLHRWEGGWKYTSIVLMVGHFIIPFTVLLFQQVKRNTSLLKAVALILIVTHWLDLYWNIMPGLHHHGPHFSWMDLTTIIGIGGIFLYYFWIKLTKYPVLPTEDPDLPKSLKFMNQ